MKNPHAFPFGIALLVLTMAPAAASSQVAAQVAGGVSPDSDYSMPVPPGCAIAAESANDLLRSEVRQKERMRNEVTTQQWLDLGCTRILLYRADVFAKEGLLMPLGASWHQGAVESFLAAIAADPDNELAASLLGWLVLNENLVNPDPRIAKSVRQAVLLGVNDSFALRGCALLSRVDSNPETALTCSKRALATGADSTWHLLEVSRRLALLSDTAATARMFDRAVDAAESHNAWPNISWHLGWFLEPEEQAEWDSLPVARRAAWVRNVFASRDVRDGRTPGTRLVEHFTRLDHVDRNFRVDVRRRDQGRFRVGATAENRLVPENILSIALPELVPALRYREYIRPYLDHDDRAAVWMRFGKPSRRATWSGTYHVDPDTLPAGGVLGDSFPAYFSNVREAWRYDLDGARLLLNFEGESFDASAEATRLVTGVLGNYLCDVDVGRCTLTARVGTLGISQETAYRIRREDHEHIVAATTQDDNSHRHEHHLTTVASLHRVWSPANNQLLALIPYAVRLDDLDRSSDSVVVQVAFRQWDSDAGAWRQERATHRVKLPSRIADDDWLTGNLEVATSPGALTWSVIAEQDSSRGGRVSREARPLDRLSDLALSDIVLGSPLQGQTWRPRGGAPVPLAPLGAFDLREPINLFWQVQSRGPVDEMSVSIAIYRDDRSEPSLTVSDRGRLASGLNALTRTIGVERLEAGIYRLELTLELPDGRRIDRSSEIVEGMRPGYVRITDRREAIAAARSSRV